MTSIVLKSPAKINLYLRVINKRNDGFHNIITLFERINLFDTITVRIKKGAAIKIKCGYPGVPEDENNLAYKAAVYIQNKFKIRNGVHITIRKHIPVAAGLGGGSSNAAAVIEGMNKLFRLDIPRYKLLSYAEKIGSDVPFFLSNNSFAWGVNKGTKIAPINIKNKFWHILVVPKVSVSTKEIYESWSKTNKLTKHKFSANIFTSALKSKNFDLINRICSNSLENIVLKRFDQVRKTKELLQRMGLKTVLMSGSGPSLFNIVPSRKEAIGLYKKLSGRHNYQVFLVQTF